MAQRHMLRGACRGLSSAFQGAPRSGMDHGSSGSTLRSVINKMHGGAASAMGFGPSISQAQGARGLGGFTASPSVPMGFAASAPSVSAGSATGSLVQVR
ncbi:hypothetical protein TSOC_005817 [Tetrabaena socialis]|uniref:Uncharacterized protein n=1 Tax=Tetrabaena socialis TaxID=47790 RepID=A0A2J8A597_9CHLO|nr:hypothetical protein TSOC_005817 [Tetrabaena socialis]|eukprot:PNH07673.1 hypothetical protein TSOC_005817 [Tetrabaena socialis]